MATRCLVLLVLAYVALADVNSDMWESYADQIRRSVGFDETLKNNPDYTLSLVAKSSMVMLGNDDPCIHNQAVTSLADSLSSPGPVFVPGTGGFFSAYKLFLNSIKPKTANNPSLIPQLAKDKQNFLKLADTFAKMQREVFQGYKEYKESLSDVDGAKKLDLISWRTKYFPKYAVLENTVSAQKTKIDKAEAELWGPAFSTIQDAKKKVAMAESLETQTAYNMPVCPQKAAKALSEYEDPDTLAANGETPEPATPQPSAVENYTPLFSIQGAQKFLQEMKNAALSSEGAEELRVQVTKTKSTFKASDFGWDASARVTYSIFFSGSASASSNTKKKAGTNDFDSVDIAFAGHRTLTIDPPPWYDSSLVATFWNSLYPGMEGRLFGPTGQFNVVPRQVVLGYNPTFRIHMTREAWDSYQKDFSASGSASFRVGAFGVSANGGSKSHDESQNYSFQDGTLEIRTRSDSLYLLAVVGQKVISQQKSFLGFGKSKQKTTQQESQDAFEKVQHLNFDDENGLNFDAHRKFKKEKEKDHLLFDDRRLQDHLGFQEDGSKNLVSWGHESLHENSESLIYDLSGVSVERGEVEFAFTSNSFNIEKTEDAVFTADLSIKSRDNQHALGQ